MESKLRYKVRKYFTSKRSVFARKSQILAEQLYLKDTPVSNKQEDKFQFSQMAEIIYDLLEQGQLPLHIGLLGTWGTGKTSVLKLLEAKVKSGRKRNQKYFLKFINVWKFADDAPSLHRKIVREVESQLKVVNEEGIFCETSTQESKKTSGIWAIFDKTIIKKHGVVVATCLIFSIIITLLYEWIFNLKDPWVLAQTNSTILLILILAYGIMNKSNLEFTYQETKKELALLHGDQFEHRFERAVTDYLKANKGKRLILVFDDLDRLPPKQLVAALNTIKTFLRSDHCAFIVPCDEENLHEGITNAFSDKKMSNLSVSEYLNKTFDLQLHLPLVEKVNMRSYAKKVLIEQNVKWAFDSSLQLDRILAILVHTGVKTPRHVKKILNAFAFDWYLTQKRDNEAGVVFLSKHPLVIAVFSVLKTDFPDFFRFINTEPFSISKPFKEQMEKYSQYDPDAANEDSQKLEAFISRIKTVIPNDPRPFIYFNNQILNPLTGRPELENAKEYLINGQDEKFQEAFFALSDIDKEVVLSSALEDIDVTHGIFVDNCLKVLIEHNEALKYTVEIDLYRWEKLFVENIGLTKDFEILEVCNAMDNLSCHTTTWKVFGNSISTEEDCEELTDLWVKHWSYFELLKIEDAGNKIITGYKKLNKVHMLANLLDSVENNNYSILNNENLDWLEIIEKSILTDNLPDLKLSEWLTIWSRKTGKALTCKIINNILDEFSFKDSDYLLEIGDIWCSLYEASPQQQDMLTLLNLMTNDDFSGFSNENLVQIADFFKVLDYKTISSYVHKIFKSRFAIDEDSTFELMEIWKETPGVASFASDIFSVDLEDEKLALVTEILKNRAERVPEKNTIVESINTALTNAMNQNQRKPSVVFVIENLFENNVWNKKIKQYINSWFPDDPLCWLQWPEDVVRDRIEIGYILSKDEQKLEEKIFQSLFSMFRVYQGVLGTSAHYRSYAGPYINILLNKMIESELINWDNRLNQLCKIDLNNGTTGSVFPILDSPVLDKTLIQLNRFCEMNNPHFRSIFVEYHIPSSARHLEIAADRWDYFDSEDRKTYLEKFGNSEEHLKYKESFAKRLIQVCKLKPNLTYIDEIKAWGFSNTSSSELTNTIVDNCELDNLNKWFSDTLAEVNEEMGKWEFNALKRAVITRQELRFPDISILEDTLRLQDERSAIALQLIKNDKKATTHLRDSLRQLRDAYPEEIEDIRKLNRWKKI